MGKLKLKELLSNMTTKKVLVGFFAVATSFVYVPSEACDQCSLKVIKSAAKIEKHNKECTECDLSELKGQVTGPMELDWARDTILTAAQNQKGLPLEGMSRLQSASEELLAPYLVAKNEVNNATPEVAEAPRAPSNQPAERKKFDPKKIVARDAKLPLPPTSFVDQSVKADKKVEIVLHEGKTYIGNGVMYEGFLINDKVPGPTVIVEEGDVVEFTVKNEGDIPHGASIHAAYTQTSKFLGNIPAGESRTLKFKVNTPGVYMYHCAPGGHAIGMHVIGGQYGMMVVKPKKKFKLEQQLGHKPDLELYMIQHELYSNGKDAIEGKPPYTLFNGRLFKFVEEPIKVRPGDYVRINFLNVGPNLLSTFHIVGIIWDYVYWQGNPDNMMKGGQSVTAGPSDAFTIEFRIPPAEGSYTMLSHAVGSTLRGAVGLLVADRDHKPAGTILADGPEYSDKEFAELEKKATRTINPFGIGSPDVDVPVKFKDKNEEVIVRIIGNSYSPKIIEVPVGTTVTWINEEAFTYLAGEVSGIHNVVSIKGPESFVAPLLAHGQKWSHKFTKAGDYEYMCAPHPYMKGIVRVKK